MKCCLIIASIVCLAIINPVTKSDISDDECGIFAEEETTAVASSTDKAVVSTQKPKTDYFKKRIPKKSLLIVFDGTSSMTDDLVQMREAAKQIVNNLSTHPDKPIKNYVLTVFKDPGKWTV